MSAPSSRRPPLPDNLDAAERVLGAIVDILRAMAVADISCGHAPSGPALDWLAEQMGVALDMLEPNAPPVGRRT